MEKRWGRRPGRRRNVWIRTGVETNDGGGIGGFIYTKEGDGKREFLGLVKARAVVLKSQSTAASRRCDIYRLREEGAESRLGGVRAIGPECGARGDVGPMVGGGHGVMPLWNESDAVEPPRGNEKMAFDRRDGCGIDRRLRDQHGQTAQAGSARTGRASDRRLGTDPDYCVVVRRVEVRAICKQGCWSSGASRSKP